VGLRFSSASGAVDRFLWPCSRTDCKSVRQLPKDTLATSLKLRCRLISNSRELGELAAVDMPTLITFGS
jgi:hypothetical protein